MILIRSSKQLILMLLYRLYFTLSSIRSETFIGKWSHMSNTSTQGAVQCTELFSFGFPEQFCNIIMIVLHYRSRCSPSKSIFVIGVKRVISYFRELCGGSNGFDQILQTVLLNGDAMTNDHIEMSKIFRNFHEYRPGH